MEILRFTASWCSPCKILAKNIELLNHPTKIKAIDLDDNLVMAQKYSIRSVPTMVAIRNGAEIGRKSGALTVPQLREWFESLSDHG